MKHYFLLRKNQKHGPYTIDDLKNQKINEDYFVWTSEETEWKRVTEFPELLSLIAKKPPLSPVEKRIADLKFDFKWKMFIPILSGLFVGIIAYFIARNVLSGNYYSTFMESRYYEEYETGLIRNMTRSFRAILSEISDDVHVYVLKDENLFLKMVFFSLFDAFLVFGAIFGVKYFSIVNSKKR